MIWFSADYHFNHRNVLGFCNRPFKDIWEMDRKIISNHNEIVSQNDKIYILGDIAMNANYGAKCLSRMNGKKYLIKGNHDKIKPALLEQLEWVEDYYELYIQDNDALHKKQLIVLMHYAMRVWNKSHYNSYHAFAHSHGTLSDDLNSLSIDVGVDAIAHRSSEDRENLDPNQYRPISYEEVKNIMNEKLRLMEKAR